MFERGKKELETGQPGDRPVDSGRPVPPAQTAARRSGTGQVAVIGRSIQISGDVKGDEDLLIEGDVSGTVELKNSSLTIGQEGKVKANIYARSINVDGTTEGDLFASERISIRASAHVRGNLVAPRVSLEDGAGFKGSIDMDQQSVEKALGRAQTKSAGRPEPAASSRANGDAAKPAPAQTGT